MLAFIIPSVVGKLAKFSGSAKTHQLLLKHLHQTGKVTEMRRKALQAGHLEFHLHPSALTHTKVKLPLWSVRLQING